MNHKNNFFVKVIKRIVSKNFLAVFKKDNFFTIDTIRVKSLVNKPIKNKVYSGGCAKQAYGNIQKEK